MSSREDTKSTMLTDAEHARNFYNEIEYSNNTHDDASLKKQNIAAMMQNFSDALAFIEGSDIQKNFPQLTEHQLGEAVVKAFFDGLWKTNSETPDYGLSPEQHEQLQSITNYVAQKINAGVKNNGRKAMSEYMAPYIDGRSGEEFLDLLPDMLKTAQENTRRAHYQAQRNTNQPIYRSQQNMR